MSVQANSIRGISVGGELACAKTESSVIQTMLETSQRMEEIENKLGTIKNYLFGPEPCHEGECSEPTEPNVRALANDSRYSANRIVRMLDEIYDRLAQ